LLLELGSKDRSGRKTPDRVPVRQIDRRWLSTSPKIRLGNLVGRHYIRCDSTTQGGPADLKDSHVRARTFTYCADFENRETGRKSYGRGPFRCVMAKTRPPTWPSNSQLRSQWRNSSPAKALSLPALDCSSKAVLVIIFQEEPHGLLPGLPTRISRTVPQPSASARDD